MPQALAYNARPLCAEVLREGSAFRVVCEQVAAETLAAAERTWATPE